MMGGWAMKTKGCSDYMCPKQAYDNHGPCRFISFFWTVLVWRDYGHQPHKHPRLVSFALPRNIAEEERQQRLLKVAIVSGWIGPRVVEKFIGGWCIVHDCLWLSHGLGWFGDFGGCIKVLFPSYASLLLQALLPGAIRDFVCGCISESGAEPDHDQGCTWSRTWCQEGRKLKIWVGRIIE